MVIRFAGFEETLDCLPLVLKSGAGWWLLSMMAHPGRLYTVFIRALPMLAWILERNSTAGSGL